MPCLSSLSKCLGLALALISGALAQQVSIAELAEQTEAVEHHTTHGCKCLSEWKYNGKKVKECNGPPEVRNGRLWCEVSKACKQTAGKDDDLNWDYCHIGPDWRLHHVLTMDPCLETVQNHNGPTPFRRNIDHWPKVLFPLANHTSRHVCCSDDGTKCLKWAWSKEKKIHLCQRESVTYEAAQKICKNNGGRLCNPDELKKGVCCHRLYSECNVGNSWSSSEKSFPDAWGEKDDVSYKGGTSVELFLSEPEPEPEPSPTPAPKDDSKRRRRRGR